MKKGIKELSLSCPLQTFSSPNLFIADYASQENNGEVKCSSEKPKDIATVNLKNKNVIKICFQAFQNKALRFSRSRSSQQCECVLFPDSDNNKDWILFIETKYTNKTGASKYQNQKPSKALGQILDTVAYFRSKSIIKTDKLIHALIAYPKITKSFTNFINVLEINGERISIARIKYKYNIIVRTSNVATIIDNNKIEI